MLWTGTIHLGPQSHLQVAVAAAGAAAPLVQVTAGRTVEEVTVVVAAAVLVQDVPHLGLEEGHVHVDGHHLQESTTLSSASTFSLQHRSISSARRERNLWHCRQRVGGVFWSERNVRAESTMNVILKLFKVF